MYFGRYLGTIVRNILGEMANHHNMVSKATLQSLSQGFPSFDNMIQVNQVEALDEIVPISKNQNR